MNLTCVSGKIGNGKTLWTIQAVEKLRLDESREVFYHGIPNLTLPWKPLPMCASGYNEKEIRDKRYPAMVPDWRAAPSGSIVVIDEAWEFFPKRPVGHKAPAYVEELANVRRMGLQFFFITQDPNQQIDNFVRSFVVRHVYLERKFGLQYSAMFDWPAVHDQTSRSDLAKAQMSRWIFPKEFFGVYKSAEEHTVKAKLPWKKIVTLVAASVVAVVGLWYGITHIGSGKKKGDVAVDSSGRASGTIMRTSGDFWIRDRVERVAGVPASAPVYDELQKVRSQPRPEGCMQLAVGSSVRCECTGPNHSVLAISLTQCIGLVKKGWFDETRKYEDAKAANASQLNGVSTRESAQEKPTS